MPTVTISVITYNSAEHIKDCLQSIAAQTYPNIDLVVFDNASTDDSVAIVKAIAPQSKMIIESRNTGFAAAHNRVIEQSSSDYVLVLNDDCALEPDYVEKLVAFMELHTDAGSATGALYRVSSLTERSVRDTIDTLGLCINRCFHVANIGSGTDVISTRDPFSLFGVPATAAIYRSKALRQCAIKYESESRQVQYFDEQFFIYKEDVDLAARLYRYGWNAYCIPTAEGYHIRSTSTRTFKRNTSWINEISYRNHLWFVCKNVAPADGILTYLSIGAYETAKLIYLLIREPRTLLAFSDIIKGMPQIIEKRRAMFRSIASPRTLLFERCLF